MCTRGYVGPFDRKRSMLLLDAYGGLTTAVQNYLHICKCDFAMGIKKDGD